MLSFIWRTDHTTQTPIALQNSNDSASGRMNLQELSSQEREKKVEAIFEKLRETPTDMKIWLNKMPKGGDLHNHLIGSIYSESLLKLAIKANLYFDPKTNYFSKEPKEGLIPASEVETSAQLLIQFSNAISMRATAPINGALGHDHFMYECFGIIDSIAAWADPRELVEMVRKQAHLQNTRYLELMVGLNCLKQLASSFKEMDQTPKVKFIVEISRIQSDDSMFEKNVTDAIEMIKLHPEHVVSFNIVGPEDNLIAQSHFAKQMEIIDRLWQKNQPLAITLHSGELTQKFSSPDYLKDRIKLTIQQGHAKRIGHGVSITEEENAPAVLKEMRHKQIVTEVCLSSNEGILGVKGKLHPIHTYLKHQVPIVLGSDDCGVNRADFCEQFFLAMDRHKLTYSMIKELVRNSLEFAFMPGKSIFISRDGKVLDPLFKGINESNWSESSQAKEFLDESERAREQVALEREFVKFEMEMIQSFAEL